jgi:thiol-disulfide isomerase/thioredoxin
MRLLLLIILSISIKNSHCQTPVGSPASAQAHYTTLYIQSQDVFDAAKKEDFYRALRSIIIQYPKDEFSFSLIALAVNLTYQQVNTLISLTDPSISNSPNRSWADITLKRIAVAEAGKLFPSLILTDTTGEKTAVTDMKGKIVFIDVWSSWCVTCREKIPDIKKIYKKYKNKGLEVIGISLDDDRQKWLNAIKKDKQPWKAYCEPTKFSDNKNDFTRRFQIYGIPVNYLIDENGILVGQDLEPESLNAWLAQHK